jgi:hypothetical protein
MADRAVDPFHERAGHVGRRRLVGILANAAAGEWVAG